MITFSTLGANGRLGNQLFQYSILKYISINTDYEIRLPHSIFNNVHHGQKCMLNNFKLKSCVFLNEIKTKYVFSEDGFFDSLNKREYDTSLLNINDDTDLMGFFQNPKYYQTIRNELIDEFEINDSIKIKINDLIKDIKKPLVSLHVRRGDLSDNTNPIDYNWANDFSENSIQYRYYSQALSLIPKDCKIILFTGGSRLNNNKNDYDLCKKIFTDNRLIFLEDLNDIETFYLMSICNYNITSFSSTFSWWASFLNKNNNIIAPKIYYPTIPMDSNKIYPTNWHLINL